MLPFALNHMSVPALDTGAFLKLASQLNCTGVEFRNDLGRPLFEGLAGEEVKDLATDAGVEIITLAEVKAFNDFTDATLAQAIELMSFAKSCGASGISLIPRVGGASVDRGEQGRMLERALVALAPALAKNDLIGFIEPIGFADSTLRFKEDAVATIEGIGEAGQFKLVHDTFHHFLAAETQFFASHTGLVHVSGVIDPSVTAATMSDADRVLVTNDDRLENIQQIRALTLQGFTDEVSMEAFSKDVHNLIDPESELRRSFNFITSQLADIAA